MLHDNDNRDNRMLPKSDTAVTIERKHVSCCYYLIVLNGEPLPLRCLTNYTKAYVLPASLIKTKATKGKGPLQSELTGHGSQILKSYRVDWRH